MKKNIKRILVLCLAAVIILTTVTTAIAATIYYYFGYYYTYINSDMVSLYGINKDELDVAFVPDTLNNKKLVDIGNNAFNNNTDIRLIDFAGATNLERIGSFAFNGCTNVTGEIKIPANVTVIEMAAFQNCTSFDTLVYNATCGYVPNQCCNGCTALNSVTLNDTVTVIGDYAFADCPSLTYIVIPASVTEIAATAFMNDNITLGVYTNSAAHQFAVDNGYEFVLLDAPAPTEPPTEAPTAIPTELPTEMPTAAPTQAATEAPTEQNGYYLGDVNNNGYVDILDATLIQRALADFVLPDYCDLSHGDVDGSGDFQIVDATLIGRYLAELRVDYPIGEWIAVS